MVNRRGSSMMELMLAIVIIGAVLAPGIGVMKKQVENARWSNDRMIAMQLTNELLDYYKMLGYDGIRAAFVSVYGPAFPTKGAAPSYLLYESYSGGYPGASTPYSGPFGNIMCPYASGFAPSWENAIHPALGGPQNLSCPTYTTPLIPSQNVTVPFVGVYSHAADYVAPPTGVGSEFDATVRQVYAFRRHVEIFGGDFSNTPGFTAFPGWPSLDCYMIRVTIDTNQVGAPPTGTMVKPQDAYQVVTYIARH